MISYWDCLESLLHNNGYEIERPKGSRHPVYNYIYAVDYGFIKNTKSMDNGGIDIWIGTDTNYLINGIICTIDLLKQDSEIKVLYNCTEVEINMIQQFHNSTNNMKSLLILK